MAVVSQQSRRFLVVVPRHNVAGELSTTKLAAFRTQARIFSKEDSDSFNVLLKYDTPRRLDYIQNVAHTHVSEHCKVATATLQSEAFYVGWECVVYDYPKPGSHNLLDFFATKDDSDDEAILQLAAVVKRKRESLIVYQNLKEELVEIKKQFKLHTTK